MPPGHPRGAAYCYHDGTPLDGRGDSSAIDAGSRPFTAPFVLPTGQSCRNFNQLALACREEPAAALTVLAKGPGAICRERGAALEALHRLAQRHSANGLQRGAAAGTNYNVGSGHDDALGSKGIDRTPHRNGMILVAGSGSLLDSSSALV